MGKKQETAAAGGADVAGIFLTLKHPSLLYQFTNVTYLEIPVLFQAMLAETREVKASKHNFLAGSGHDRK
jgi:hypothetical protein